MGISQIGFVPLYDGHSTPGIYSVQLGHVLGVTELEQLWFMVAMNNELCFLLWLNLNAYYTEEMRKSLVMYELKVTLLLVRGSKRVISSQLTGDLAPFPACHFISFYEYC